MVPIIFVAVQLVALVWTSVSVLRRNPSPVFRALWLAGIAGIAGGLDVWYLGWHAYPGGFAF